MIELLTTYSLVEILVLLFMLFVGLKEVWSLFDFFKNKIKSRYDAETKDDKKIEEVFNRLNEFEQNVQKMWKKEEGFYNEFIQFKDEWNEYLEKTNAKLELLTQSDKDSIKSWIVEKHHLFVKQGWVDDFNMDAIERRFTHYEEEGGNSYVCDLMKELRRLPNYPPE